MSHSRSTAFNKVLKTLEISHDTRPDLEVYTKITELETCELTDKKKAYKGELSISDKNGRHLGECVGNGRVCVADSGCVIQDSVSTYCLHNKGTISVAFSNSNVTDEKGLFNIIGSFVAGKIINGSGAFLGKQGYVIIEVLKDLKRNAYFYFTKDASQSEVDGISNKLENISNLVNEGATQISALETDMSNLQTDMSNFGSMETLLNNINDVVSPLQTDMSDLKTDVTTLQTNIGNINGTLGFLDGFINFLRDIVSGFETDVPQLKTDVTTLQTDVATLQTDVSGQTNTINLILARIYALEHPGG
jgi:hypothetical protein